MKSKDFIHNCKSGDDMQSRFNVGDEVWFLEHWSQMPIQAHITTLHESYADLQWISGGSNSQPFESLHHSREDLIKAVNEKSEQVVADHKALIKTVEDLVRFMFEHTVSYAEEYTDFDARIAAKERAKELLDIDV